MRRAVDGGSPEVFGRFAAAEWGQIVAMIVDVGTHGVGVDLGERRREPVDEAIQHRALSPHHETFIAEPDRNL